MSKVLTKTSKKPLHFPLVLDSAAANQRLSDFLALYNETYSIDIKNLVEEKQQKELLLAVFSNSPYLTRMIFKYPDFSAQTLSTPGDNLVENIFAKLEDTHFQSITELMRELRICKAEIALTLAFADLSGNWQLDKITKTLSSFAELCLKAAINYLMKDGISSGQINHQFSEADISENSGYSVIAMGKLGGYELNYSSDIDLIVLFDLDIVRYEGRRSAQDYFVKFTQKLVKIMSDRTEDGYVFRTDLRLRPDPGATPIAISMEGAETYYQSIGLNWERAAMIKARPVAGDIEAGNSFLERIRGFVWRKHLDYAALDDIHAIKKLIHQHHSHTDIQLDGHDVKLGRGGIREIEFFAQIHQLISGGREPALRIAPTQLALHALCDNRKFDQSENDTLQEAYVFLRTLEHRLQMINDDQTHEIPTSEDEILRVVKFMGYEDKQGFERDLMHHLLCVHDLFNSLLKDTHQTDDDKSLSFPLDRYHPDTLKAITKAGFQDQKKIYEVIQRWQLGRYRACRTERARRILRQLVPDILDAFGHHNEPDASLIKFDDFLSRLPSGVQLFSFIKAQPWLLELLAQITGLAPFLSNQLSRNPLMLDSVLNAEIFKNNSSIEQLEESLKEQILTARDFQDVLDITRKWTNEGKFQVGLQILRGKTDLVDFSRTLADIAEVSLRVMISQVRKEFSLKNGVIEDSSLCVLAMGKLGGHEFTTTSDVDMVLIFDADDMDTMSNGEKSLSVNHYYARLCQNFINSITALTGEGKLYEVDVRLRPSGISGPLAVSVESFNEYQKGQAWTWEHMALTRARVISGPDLLRKKIDKVIGDILCHKKRDQENLLHEVAKMRKRLDDNYKTTNIWAMKHIRGGLIDVEFICQYLTLKHGADRPDILSKNTLGQIENITKCGILDDKKGKHLYEACHTLQSVQAVLRLCLGSASKDNARSPALIKAISDRLGCKSSELEGIILKKQKYVLDLYNEIIEIPASELKQHEPTPPIKN